MTVTPRAKERSAKPKEEPEYLVLDSDGYFYSDMVAATFEKAKKKAIKEFAKFLESTGDEGTIRIFKIQEVYELTPPKYKRLK